MEQDKLEKYLLRIGDLVLDEDKIVTYKFLSRTLDVHVNTAKQLLYMFLLQQQELNPCNVSATYLLAGLLKDGSYVVSVVTEDSLNAAYLKYDNITSEHVYSIQKGRASSVENHKHMLYAADSMLKHLKNVVIKCDDVIIEDTSEDSCDVHTESATEDAKSSVNAESVKETAEKTESMILDCVKQTMQKEKKTILISQFFTSKSQQKNLNTEEKIEAKPGCSKSIVDEVPNKSKNIDEIDLKKMSISEEVPKDKRKKEKESSKSEKVVPKKKSKTAKEIKKRKRILSDSEQSESDEEVRDAMLRIEPDISDIPQSSGRLNISDDEDNDDLFRPKKKKKKIIDKTILHEDGYLETIKEIVYETDSESESQSKKEDKTITNENLPSTSHNSTSASHKSSSTSPNLPPTSRNLPKTGPSKPQQNTKGKTAASKNTGKKQQTILSFFKKN